MEATAFCAFKEVIPTVGGAASSGAPSSRCIDGRSRKKIGELVEGMSCQLGWILSINICRGMVWVWVGPFELDPVTSLGRDRTVRRNALVCCRRRRQRRFSHGAAIHCFVARGKIYGWQGTAVRSEFLCVRLSTL